MAEGSSGRGKWLTPLLAVLVVVLVIAWNFLPVVEISSTGPDRSTREQVYFGPLKSIAVLPFKLKNVPAEQEFWSSGLSAELTRLLMQVRGLTVTSSNSTLFFRGRQATNRMIAERLHANHLLLGTFRLDGETAHVDLRLFNARKDADIWSRSFELETTNLFNLQVAVLEDVISAMKAGKAGKVPEIEPVSTDAWVSYLQGVYHQQSRTAEGFRLAEEAFRSALGYEPGFELARVALVSSGLARNLAGDQASMLVENARAELKTIQSKIARPYALGLMSYISRNYDWDWGAAVASGEASVKLNPRDPELKGIASLALFSVGRFQRAGTLMEEAVQQDPLNLALKLRLGLLQEFATDYEAALGSYRQLLGMNPDFPGARAFRARIKLIQQKPASALKESEQETDAFWKRYSGILALTASERFEEATVLLEQMIAEDGLHAAYQIAEILAFRGDLDGSFEWLNRAYLHRDGGMKELVGNYFLKNLHQDPRWQELLERIGLPLDLES